MNLTKKSIKVEKDISKISNKLLEGSPTPAQIKRLEASAKKASLSVEEINTMYNECYAELVGKAVKANLEQLALNGVLNAVRKLTKKNDFVPTNTAKQVIGFVVADSGVFDKLEMFRNIAKNYATKNGHAAAVEEKLIDEEGKVLDKRDKLFGKPNDNFNKPLKANEHDMTRTLDVIVRINGEKDYIYAPFQSNDPATVKGWESVRFFTPAQTFANVKTVLTDKLSAEEKADMSEEAIADFEKENSEIQLTSSQAKDTPSTFTAVHDEEVDVDKIFLQVTDPLVTPMANLEAIHEEIKNPKGKCPFNKRFFVDGIITWVNRDRPDFAGRITMGMMDKEDESVEIRVKVPKELVSEFGEQSEVRIIGKTTYFQSKVDEKWVNSSVGLEASGVYVRLAAPADNAKSEENGEITPIVGWVE